MRHKCAAFTLLVLLLFSCERDVLHSRKPEFLPPDNGNPIVIEVDENSLHFVNARVGDITGRFLIDTGAAISALNTAFTGDVKLTQRALVWIGTSLGIPRPLWSGHAPGPLSIDGLSVPRVRWIKTSFPDLASEYAGVLGRDVLSHFALKLEYSSGVTMLMPRTTFAPSHKELIERGYARLPLTADARLQTSIGGRVYPTLLDSGKYFSISLRTPPPSGIYVGSSFLPVTDIFGRSSKLETYEVETMNVGAVEHSRVSVEVQRRRPWFRPSQHASLGVAFLRTADWYISLASREVWYRPIETARHDRFSGTVIDFEIWTSDDLEPRLVVTKISHHNPLYREFGIRARDTIVSVDGAEPFTMVSPEKTGETTPELMKLLWIEFETVRILRDGKIIDITQ